MNHGDIEFIIKNFGGIVVIDEAYIDFSEQQSFSGLTDQYENLIVMQTFSKALGLAAARIGIAISNKHILKYFNKVKPPYNISSINQLEALEKILDLDLIKTQVSIIKKEKERLASGLEKLKVTEKIFPSDSNFLLVKVTDANKLYNDLISNNIVIRNRNNVVNGCLRITVGKRSENDELLRAIKELTE
jgi:histidinol-phosphate aminotransferase